MIGPCSPYNTVEDLRASPLVCPPDPEPSGYDEVLQSFIDRADEVIYVLTGRQFPGTCEAVRWPMRRDGSCWGDFSLPFSSLMSGRAPVDDAIPLWGSPRDIVITIDGVEFTGWYLRNGRDLVRADGGSWPSTNRPDLPPEADGTFYITWKFGPPTPGIVAAASLDLAVQFQLESVRDPRCALPPGTTSSTRQGQSITIDRDVERVREAGPSLESIMVATAAFNPYNSRTPPDVWSPDHLWDLISVG